MLNEVRRAVVMLLLLTGLCGIAYPLFLTAVARLAFPHQSAGSLIAVDGRVVGSELIGQAFTLDRYFHGRPSHAGSGLGYDAMASGGSNLGPASRALAAEVAPRVARLKAAGVEDVPVDLVTSSASGLDPHITPAAAEAQVERVAEARGLSPDRVRDTVRRLTEPAAFGVLGDRRVNVLKLNLLLDRGGPEHDDDD